MKTLSAPALFFMAWTSSVGQVPKTLDFNEAEKRIVRLPPTAFPELPRNLSSELRRRGCGIPQDAFSKKPANVIRGHFAAANQTDWAVLCSAKGISTILVFWNGSEKNPAAIAPMQDRMFLQGITADQIGFSRGINAVGREYIMRHYEAWGPEAAGDRSSGNR